jgi:hypothetical protein
MPLASLTGMQSSNDNDKTTNPRWLLEHSDRLLRYECELRRKSGASSELFPDELSDKIGRTQGYVCGIIKNAIARAKLCHKPNRTKH